MNKTFVGVGVVLVLIFAVVLRPYYSKPVSREVGTVSTKLAHTELANTKLARTELGQPTERYSAQVGRVQVQFDQWEYTRYRLQTNQLVREGEMNSKRGFEDDPDATVYVLNGDKSVGEHILYVRLTSEPGYLYALDSEQKIIRGGRLGLEQ